MDSLAPSPRERRDAAAHRQQVLDAARRLFETRGLDGVTMDEIAAAAGVGKGTLYRRFPDKGQLVLALMGSCVAGLDDDLSRLPVSGSALDDLHQVLARIASWIEEHAAELCVVAEQTNVQRGTVYSTPLYGWMHARVLACLQRAVAQGETHIKDPVYTADVLLAALRVDLYEFQRSQRGYTLAHILAGLRELVEGLRA